jgi:hypothetical protein
VAPPPREPVAMPLPARTEEPPPPPALFERVGGSDAMTGVVDELTEILLADKRFGRLFRAHKRDNAKLRHLKEVLYGRLCTLSDGACVDEGDWKAEGLAFSDAQWDAFVADLAIALSICNVSTAEADDLLKRVGVFRQEMAASASSSKANDVGKRGATP